jgi:transposase
MKQYSTDLRERVCRALDTGATRAEVARLFGVSPSSITRWQQAREQTGSVAAKPRPGRPPKLSPADAATLVAQVLAAPEATLAQHAQQWEHRTAVRVSVATLSRTLARARITSKKRPWSPANRIPTPGRPGGSVMPDSIRGK